MSFAKNVNKYYKWVLVSIVAIMAVSLVVSGNLSLDGKDPDEHYATIFTDVKVTLREWEEAKAKAGAWFRLKAVRDIDEGTDYSAIQMRDYLFRFRDGPGLLVFHEPFKPSDADRLAAARELIILGYDAKSKQIRATEEEVDAIISGFLDRAGVGMGPDDADRQVKFAGDYFLASPQAFRAAVRDSILIQRALSLDVGGCNTRYEDLFNQKLSSARSVKVLVAGIDGAGVPTEPAAVSDADIRARFEQDRDNYKMPAKVQVEYLMANFEDFKAKIKDPTPEEIQKYYDDHKREFLKPAAAKKDDHDHKEGDDHKHDEPVKDEYWTLQEKTEEIVKKIKDLQAARDAYALMRDLNSKNYSDREYKIRKEEELKEPKDPKSVRERVLARTGPILAEIRDEQKAKGIELRNGITRPFDKNDREPFMDELGKFTGTGADPSSEWAFQQPVGEVANQVYRSDKGYSLIRIAFKIESYATDLTGPIREKIRQDLRSEGAGGRARRLADELVSRIKANGASEVAKLKKRGDVKIQHSAYIGQALPDAESGLTPAALVQQIKSTVLKTTDTPKPPGAPQDAMEAQAIHGTLLGGDRKDWSYVVVVEDAVQTAPEVKDEDFLSEVRQKEREEAAKARVNQAQKLVESAEWRDVKAAPAQ
ncbi:MAG TPA: hypothetical protein VFS19_05245 [Planctomycetota bacterium]|nr:hypothetical protein [Planctomycetota bacterium]